VRLRLRLVGEKIRGRVPRLGRGRGVGSVGGRGRLGGRAVLVRRSVGFGVVFALQFPDVMTFTREPEDQGAESEREPGFAKKWSHKVRHSKRQRLRRARRTKPEEENVERPTSKPISNSAPASTPFGNSRLDVRRWAFGVFPFFIETESRRTTMSASGPVG
jgi:hypothetical protein